MENIWFIVIIAVSLIANVTLGTLYYLKPTEIATVCESPYIVFGQSCCIDSNTNSICDSDEENQEEEAVEEIKQCPESCDDNNVCTVDACSAGTNYTCTYSLISSCCGNGFCDGNETVDVCPQDCKIEVNTPNLEQEFLRLLNLKNVAFIVNESRDFIVHSHPLVWGNVIEIKDTANNIITSDGLKTFSNNRALSHKRHFNQKATSLSIIKNYNYTTTITSEEVSERNITVMKFVHLYSYDVYSRLRDKKEFLLYDYIPVYTYACKPNIVIEVYGDPNIVYQPQYSVGGKTTENIQKSLDTLILNKDARSLFILREFIEFCQSDE